MVDPPSGTVTFLFTDVEGSTRLWEQQPVEMQVALERHDEILRSSIESHGGYVFSTAGDAFAAAFARAGSGVDAAVDAQRLLGNEAWPVGVTLRVRMGLHTGEAHEREGDYFGSALNRAARIMGLGAGDQILMSAVTAGIVDVDRRSEGLCELRGLAERMEIFTVLAEGLPAQFPTLRVAAALGNLPAFSVELVGRESLLDDLVEEIRDTRLLTLVGAGGIGKTSVALELGRRVEMDFPAGVWVVELAPLRDPEAVVAALGSAVGARAGGGESLLEATLGLWSSEPALVVVDNCEHLAEAAAGMVQALLAGSLASVLATSRAPLHLRDERVRHVPALGTDGGRSDAVTLFVERARQVRDDFELTDAAADAISQICGLVDGMPLALELAAARCRSMVPADLLLRLERDAGKVLRDARRDSEERQQTLQATVRWSYELLTVAEQELFLRLSVFAGSFDLAAAEAVCAGGELDPLDVVDLLESLVDQSLVSLAESAASRSRYRLLEPIRQFGERTLEDGDAVQARHADHYAELAAVAYRAMWTAAEADWIARLEADFANQQVAYQFFADRGELTEALAIAITLNQLGELALQRPAGAEVLFTALELDGIDKHELGPIAMAHAAAALGRRQSPDAIPLARRALAQARTPEARWQAGFWGAAAGFFAPDHELTQQAFKSCVDAAAEINDPEQRPIPAEAISGWLEATYGDTDRARQLLKDVPTTADSSMLQALLINGHITLAERVGDTTRALHILLATVEAGERSGNRWAAGAAVSFAARAATQELTPTELLALIGRFLPTWRQANDLSRIGWSLVYCAHAVARLGEPESAARLLGGARLMFERDQPIHDQLIAELSTLLGKERLDSLMAEGKMTPARDLTEQVLQHVNRAT